MIRLEKKVIEEKESSESSREEEKASEHLDGLRLSGDAQKKQAAGKTGSDPKHESSEYENENEAVLTERLGTEAETFLNESFGVELLLEDNSLQEEIMEKVVVKPEIRFVTCSRERDMSR